MRSGSTRVSNDDLRGAGADTDGFAENGSSPQGGEQPGVLWIAEAERFFEEATGKICGARRRSSWNRPDRERGVGVASCGRENWRNALRAKRRPLLRSGLEHETLHYGACANETRARVPVPHHAGNERKHFERRLERKSDARRPRRSESFEPQIPVQP